MSFNMENVNAREKKCYQNKNPIKTILGIRKGMD